MTSKTTTKAASPGTSTENSQQPRKKHSVKDSVKKSNRINRQRRLQKQLQVLLLERHSRRCIICHHPEREAIEEEFVHWRSPSKLAHDYKLADYRTVYRHARAVGLLLQRRERLHSALDAFVESVDDVTFTGDTILRAMRAYSCIDSHGRWTEIPTQVQFSTSNDAHRPQPSPRATNVSADVIDIDPDPNPDEVPEDDAEEDEGNALEERVTAVDVLNVIRKYSNQTPRSDATACSVSPKIKSPNDATACAAPPAQAFNVPEGQYDELEDDNSDADEESDDDAEEDAENALEEFVTSFSTSSKPPSPNSTACSTSSKSTPCSDATACAASPAQSASGVRLNSQSRGRSVTATTCAVPPAQASSVTGQSGTDDRDDEDDPDEDPDGNVLKKESEADSLEETTACAAPPAQLVSAVPLNSNHRGRDMTSTASAASSKTRLRSDATACADPPAQALPRAVVRGQNPNDRSHSDRTDCAALPAQSAAPRKPKPDADGIIWHPHPGYPNQEMSEPDAAGRVMYKIHMTTAASQLPSRQTDAQRAAELIYRSVIKKCGNP
jgi:hypothetical protein